MPALDDFPGPRCSFADAHLARWPMGTRRFDIADGALLCLGRFDERDATVARRAFPGHHVAVDDSGLTVGPTARKPRVVREWISEDGTEHHEDRPYGFRMTRRAGEHHWTIVPSTAEERRANEEQLVADRVAAWATTVGAYAAQPNDLAASWRYLEQHPIFHSWWIPPAILDDLDAADVDEASWARIEANAHLITDQGLGSTETYVDLDEETHRTVVTIEHGPMLWQLSTAVGS